MMITKSKIENQVMAAQEHLVHAWNDISPDVEDPDAWPPNARFAKVGDDVYHLQAAIEILHGLIQEVE